MKKIFTLLFIVASFVCCNSSNPSEGPTTPKPATDSGNLLQKGCYTYNDSNNVISFEITEVGAGVTGKLMYALKEKDSNTGTFKGVLTGDTLFGNYSFLSEGVESSREVAFLVKDKQLIEGVGELNTSGNAFKDRHAINYSSSGISLSKTDCNLAKTDCIYKNGKVYSNLNQKCLELTTLKIKLQPMQEGAAANGDPAYVLFDSTQSKAELFLPGQNKGMILNQTSSGNWRSGDYKLIAWKGYVVQFKSKAIFGGE